MKQLNIQIEDNQHEWLREKAFRERVSMEHPELVEVLKAQELSDEEIREFYNSSNMSEF